MTTTEREVDLRSFTRVLGLLSLFLLIPSSVGEMFCHNDIFKAECGADEVIVMTKAMYGRMSLGRCVLTDFGFVGCFQDVLDQAHAQCSGRRVCEIRVPDPAFDLSTPCNPDLKSYLDATYKCVKVLKHGEYHTSTASSTVEDTTGVVPCSRNLTHNVTSAEGFISSSSEGPGCENMATYWRIAVMDGQRINISLFDFSSKASTDKMACMDYAYIREDGSDAQTDQSTAFSIVSCADTKPGGVVYSSVGRSVLVKIPPLLKGTYYLLKYQAIDCANIESPEYGWVKRKNDVTKIGCVTSDDKWEVTCEGTEWSGEYGNCSAATTIEARTNSEAYTLSMGTSVIIILAVSCTVGIIVLIVGLVCMKSRQGRLLRSGDLALKDMRPLSHPDTSYDTSLLYARNSAFQPVRLRVTREPHPGGHGQGDMHDYEYVWEVGSPVSSGESPGEMKGLLDSTNVGTIDRVRHQPLPPHPVPQVTVDTSTPNTLVKIRASVTIEQPCQHQTGPDVVPSRRSTNHPAITELNSQTLSRKALTAAAAAGATPVHKPSTPSLTLDRKCVNNMRCDNATNRKRERDRSAAPAAVAAAASESSSALPQSSSYPGTDGTMSRRYVSNPRPLKSVPKEQRQQANKKP